MPKIYELYKAINAWVDKLDATFDKIKQDHHDDFFIAYKIHIHKIKREL